MNSKVICFFVLIAAVHSAPQHEQAARYPAGVNPALCPGYPNCDNSVLHGTAPVSAPLQAAWGAGPAWNGPHSFAYQAAPHYDDGSYKAHYHDDGSYKAHYQHDDGSYKAHYHEGFNDYAVNDISGPGGDKFPAGVSPQQCPNYPYCDNGAAAAYHVPQPLAGFQSRQFPAGVSPHQCPNYPYCN